MKSAVGMMLSLAAVAISESWVYCIECPFITSKGEDVDIGGNRALRTFSGRPASGFQEGVGRPGFSESTYRALQDDIVVMFTNSKEQWPADFDNYAPFMIRLAWHCAGSYRVSDGRGSCDGGRIRFGPEHTWANNTNLDKALKLLQPIKVKYGDAISWRDLITLTGNTAISSMGGRVLGFCAGRLDEYSGINSLELGPSPEQENMGPCAVNGACESPLGASTIGLIYVNPEGPMGIPNPTVREVFGRMDMNDSETVALIGGGHAFGKFHGACMTGPGPDPADSPSDPWPGTCGDPSEPLFGKGPNTYTSGLEGQWTLEPTVWDNKYFTDLLEYDWDIEMSPGGKHQWFPVLKLSDIMMLTTDVALLMDAEYLKLVELFASDIEALEMAFSNAWYKLTTRDMGPVTRCVGPDVPLAQVFQMPLPDPASSPVSSRVYRTAMKHIKDIMSTPASPIDADVAHGEPTYLALFVTLAFQCMASFRSTGYMGGCNGARIRFSPQKDWADNVALDKVLEVLEPVSERYPEITYADLIVLAGYTTLEVGGLHDLPFCGGRVDATEGTDFVSALEPREYDGIIVGVRDHMKVTGLSLRHVVALTARPRSMSHMVLRGFSGSYTWDPRVVSNELFRVMISESWVEAPESVGEFRAVGKDVYVLATDLALIWDPEFKPIVEEFASDNGLFLETFAEA